jgi:cobalt-precorrin-5B (C1)-methyltransferase
LFMKKLRSGYTTGACAAAAAKGAMLVLLGSKAVREVEIPFPDGKRVQFKLSRCNLIDTTENSAIASVIKDAGDDPDVTNGATIEVCIRQNPNLQASDRISLVAGKGVGIVTKPGLAVPVGSPAINPVPRRMIIAAISEALIEMNRDEKRKFLVTISIPDGEILALKTLNKRLGIIGGLSILGTTGIVRPVSAEAWTATISTSMNVASELGISEIVLSTGRTSEKAVQEMFSFPEESLVMMGDYLKYSLEEAHRFRFSKVHLSGMWAKILKAAMGIPQTHVRNGALEVEQAVKFIAGLDVSEEIISSLSGANTAREIYSRLIASGNREIVTKVCMYARNYCEKIALLPVIIHLVDVTGRIVVSVPEGRI